MSRSIIVLPDESTVAPANKAMQPPAALPVYLGSLLVYSKPQD
jgi:hypothetical protein